MMNPRLEMIAAQYEEYLREVAAKGPIDDTPGPSLRRRTARRIHRVADAVDPGEY